MHFIQFFNSFVFILKVNHSDKTDPLFIYMSKAQSVERLWDLLVVLFVFHSIERLLSHLSVWTFLFRVA